MEIIAATNVSAIVLREKDLEETVYEALAKDCITLCTHYNKKLILHSFLESAHRLNQPYIQLSLSQLETYRKAGLLSDFAQIGTSVHSVDDVRLAESLVQTMYLQEIFMKRNVRQDLPDADLPF